MMTPARLAAPRAVRPLRRALIPTMLALGVVGLFAAPAQAEDGQGFTLHEALAYMPASMLDSPTPPFAVFVNVQAALALGRASGQTQALTTRMRAGLPLRAVAALEAGDAARWQQATGLPPNAVQYLAGFGKPATMTTIWGLGSSDRVEQFMQHLPARGFEPIAASGLSRAVANGQPLVLDLSRREAANPWLGARGQTSIAAPLPTAVVQTGAPQAAATLQHIAPERSLAEHEAIRPALEALQSAVQDGAQIVQAVVVAPPAAAAPLTPAARAALRGHTPAPVSEVQVPAYTGAIVADVQTNGQPAVGIALTYDDCVAATAAGDTLARAWQAADPAGSVPRADGQPQAQATTTVQVTTHPSSAGACAVLARLGSATQDGVTNPVFDGLLARLQEQDLPLLRIGNGASQSTGVAAIAPSPAR